VPTNATVRPILLGVVAAGLVATVYAPSLHGEFQFDDKISIAGPKAPTLDQFLEITTWLSGITGTGRPLTHLTYALNRAGSGDDPLSYHVVNILLHLAVAAFSWALTRKALRRLGFAYADVSAVLATAIFLLHPLQTQAVSYISQRAEVLASTLYLAALLLLVTSDEEVRAGQRRALRAGALLAFVLSLASKQIACTLPAAWLLYCAFFPAPSERDASPLRRVGSRVLSVLPFLALSMFSAGAGVLGTDGSHDAGFGIGWFGAREYVLTQVRVLPVYLRLLVWPSGQNVEWAFPLSRGWLNPPTTLLGAASLATMVALAFVVEQRTRACKGGAGAAARLVSFGALWFILLLIPSSSVVPLADVIEEHRPYLASWGIIAGAAAMLVAGGHVQRLRAATTTFAVILLVALGAATWRRNRVWRTEIALWTDAAQKAPEKSRVHANLGYVLARAGRHAEALESFARAYSLARDHATSIEALARDMAGSMTALGRMHEAASTLEQFVATGAAEADTVYQLALVYLNLGRLRDGEGLVRNVLARSHGFANAHVTLAKILAMRGDTLAAREELATAVRLAPWDGESILFLAETEYRLGRRADACRTLRSAESERVAPAVRGRARSLLAALGCSTE